MLLFAISRWGNRSAGRFSDSLKDTQAYVVSLGFILGSMSPVSLLVTICYGAPEFWFLLRGESAQVHSSFGNLKRWSLAECGEHACNPTLGSTARTSQKDKTKQINKMAELHGRFEVNEGSLKGNCGTLAFFFCASWLAMT